MDCPFFYPKGFAIVYVIGALPSSATNSSTDTTSRHLPGKTRRTNQNVVCSTFVSMHVYVLQHAMTWHFAIFVHHVRLDDVFISGIYRPCALMEKSKRQ